MESYCEIQKTGQYINVGIGSAGVKIADSIFQQLCHEHNINHDGSSKQDNDSDLKAAFFDETKEGLFVPRNVFIDSEPFDIDRITNSQTGRLYNPYNSINGKESTCFYTRSAYTVGREYIDAALDRVRIAAEKLDNFQGFTVHGSTVGGFGGFHDTFMERLSVMYGHKIKISFMEYPSPNESNHVLDCLNAIQSTHSILEHNDLTILWQNEKLNDICGNMLDTYDPNYNDINKLLAMGFSD